jgi:hypothetical protein
MKLAANTFSIGLPGLMKLSFTLFAIGPFIQGTTCQLRSVIDGDDGVIRDTRDQTMKEREYK